MLGLHPHTRVSRVRPVCTAWTAHPACWKQSSESKHTKRTCCRSKLIKTWHSFLQPLKNVVFFWSSFSAAHHIQKSNKNKMALLASTTPCLQVSLFALGGWTRRLKGGSTGIIFFSWFVLSHWWMIHGVSKPFETLPSVCRTPIKAGNQNWLFLPASMQAGHLDPSGRWVGGSWKTNCLWTTIFASTETDRARVRERNKRRVYLSARRGPGLGTALTWRWKLEKWRSGMNRTGWVSRSAIVLKMVTSFLFWRRGTLTSETARRRRMHFTTRSEIKISH